MQDLAQPLLVREQFGWHVSAWLDHELQALVGGQRLEDRLQLFYQRAQGKALGMDVHPPGLDLGKIQDVVDELQQI